MTTNWLEVRQICEDYGVPFPDESGPRRILETLANLGLPATEKDGLVLLDMQCRLPRETCVALVSATELFTWDDRHELRRVDRKHDRMTFALDLFARKVSMWRQACKPLAGSHAYLYVLDFDNGLALEENQALAQALEFDDRSILKLVCPPEELACLLANPFGERLSAPATPQFEVHRMDLSAFEPAPRDFAATVTHIFARERELEVWLNRMEVHADSARVKTLVNVLVRRVLGRGLLLSKDDDMVVYQIGDLTHVLPIRFLGKGEQAIFAFCIFAALAAEDATPQSWLGLTEIVNHLDLPRFVRMLDVLRDLVIATGANVYVKTNRGDYRSLAQGKLERAAQCLASTAA